MLKRKHQCSSRALCSHANDLWIYPQVTNLHKSSWPPDSYPYMLSSQDQAAVKLVGLNLTALDFQPLLPKPLDLHLLPHRDPAG